MGESARGLTRGTMNPSAGIMLRADGTVLDVAAMLQLMLDSLEAVRRVQITDANGNAVTLDEHGHLATIDLAHSKVHDGDHYICVDYAADVDIAAPKWWVISVPAATDVEYHHITEVSADQGFLLQVYEGIATDADGTDLTARNNDRNSAKTSQLAFYKDPTNPSGGTAIFNNVVGANNPKARFGGTSRNGAEIILKRDTKYGIKITVLNDNTRVSLVSEFYEQEE